MLIMSVAYAQTLPVFHNGFASVLHLNTSVQAKGVDLSVEKLITAPIKIVNKSGFRDLFLMPNSEEKKMLSFSLSSSKDNYTLEKIFIEVPNKNASQIKNAFLKINNGDVINGKITSSNIVFDGFGSVVSKGASPLNVDLYLSIKEKTPVAKRIKVKLKQLVFSNKSGKLELKNKEINDIESSYFTVVPNR